MKSFKELCDVLDPVLHERGRLAIVVLLAAAEGSRTFLQLREQLGMTDGNLSVHLQKLQDKGFVDIEKKFVGRRPQTSCRLTRAGRKALLRHLDQLGLIAREGRLLAEGPAPRES